MKDNKPYRQNKVFDNISETEEFNVYTKIDDLPLNETPAYLEEGINGICTGGSALFNVFGNKRRIVSNDLVVIFPFQLAAFTREEKSRSPFIVISPCVQIRTLKNVRYAVRYKTPSEP